VRFQTQQCWSQLSTPLQLGTHFPEFHHHHSSARMMCGANAASLARGHTAVGTEIRRVCMRIESAHAKRTTSQRSANSLHRYTASVQSALSWLLKLADSSPLRFITRLLSAIEPLEIAVWKSKSALGDFLVGNRAHDGHSSSAPMECQ
jgi:hypothetical protein